MADFTRQRQFKTRGATLKVDGGLPVGVHRFQLVVEDESGNRSNAAEVKVEIFRPRIPFDPITPIDPIDPVIVTPPIIR